MKRRPLTQSRALEGVNELQSGVFPSLQRRGGRAIKKRSRSEQARTGWSLPSHVATIRFGTWCVSDHPDGAFQRWLRSILLMAQPPLLCKEGNTPDCNSFTYRIYEITFKSFRCSYPRLS